MNDLAFLQYSLGHYSEAEDMPIKRQECPLTFTIRFTTRVTELNRRARRPHLVEMTGLMLLRKNVASEDGRGTDLNCGEYDERVTINAPHMPDKSEVINKLILSAIIMLGVTR